MCKLLPICALLLFIGGASAQDHLPVSTQAHLSTLAHLETLTPNDLSKLASEAESGDGKAQFLLALVYEKNQLVPRDLAVVRKWLKAAEQGYVPAQTGMGELLIAGQYSGAIPDYADADRRLRMVATQGDADAQLWFGVGYERGWFGVTGYREALKWIRRAAEQGQPTPQFSPRAIRRLPGGTGRRRTTLRTWVGYGKRKSSCPTCIAMVAYQRTTCKRTCGSQSSAGMAT